MSDAPITLLDLAMADAGVGKVLGAWRRLELPLDVLTEVPVQALAKVIGARRRTVSRYVSDTADAGLLTIEGYGGDFGNVVRMGVMRLGNDQRLAAWAFLRGSERCRACRHLKVNQGRTCKRCRVQHRRDLAGVLAACKEARRLRRAGKRVSPTALSAKFHCPLWTVESWQHGRLIPLQGLIRRLVRERLLTDEQITYYRNCEREAAGGSSMGGTE